MVYRHSAVLLAVLIPLCGCGKEEKKPWEQKLEGIEVTGKVEGHTAGAAVGSVEFVPVDDQGKAKPGARAADGMIEADGTFRCTVPAGKYRIRVLDAEGRPTPAQIVTVSEQSRQFVVKPEQSEDE